jgi:hypothetical protein
MVAQFHKMNRAVSFDGFRAISDLGHFESSESYRLVDGRESVWTKVRGRMPQHVGLFLIANNHDHFIFGSIIRARYLHAVLQCGKCRRVFAGVLQQ